MNPHGDKGAKKINEYFKHTPPSPGSNPPGGYPPGMYPATSPQPYPSGAPPPSFLQGGGNGGSHITFGTNPNTNGVSVAQQTDMSFKSVTDLEETIETKDNR